MSLYGVGLDVTVQKILLDLKLHLNKSGGMGVRNLQRVFRNLDTSGNGKLDIKELEAGLAKIGFFPKIVDLQALVKRYDLDGDNQLSFDEFLRSLREPLNDRRRKIVEKAFRMMDRDGSGFLDVKDIINIYDVSKHKDFKSGKKTKEAILTEFLQSFEGAAGNRDGKISLPEFLDYYTDVSMTVPSDDFFVESVGSAWCITEDDKAEVEESEVRSILKTVRMKLINKTNGIHDEFVLRKLFGDFDMNKSGFLTLDELHAMLIKLEIAVHRKYLSAIFRRFDQNNNGYIEFEEFVNYLINDPYYK